MAYLFATLFLFISHCSSAPQLAVERSLDTRELLSEGTDFHCPGDDGKYFAGVAGVKYRFSCHSYISSLSKNSFNTSGLTFNGCVNQCDQSPDCIALEHNERVCELHHELEGSLANWLAMVRPPEIYETAYKASSEEPCPGADGERLLATNGKWFSFRCNSGAVNGNLMASHLETSFAACLESCAKTLFCNAFQLENSKMCNLYNTAPTEFWFNPLGQMGIIESAVTPPRPDDTRQGPVTTTISRRPNILPTMASSTSVPKPVPLL
jgi:hypothetical protein